MNKVVLIGRDTSKDVLFDGGEYWPAKLCGFLRERFGNDNVIQVQIQRPSFLKRVIECVFGLAYGSSFSLERQLYKMDLTDVSFAFFNGSIYGSLVKKLKKRKVVTVTFYHNIESNYYYDKYMSRKGLLNYIYYRYIKKQEAITTKYTDIVINLNKRDSLELSRIYGKETSFISPVGYEPYRGFFPKKALGEKYILFVGGLAFANIDGIKRFIDNSLPEIKNIKLYIAGNCCKELAQYSNDERVVLCGFVENLDSLYCNASAVICPLYSGSGMKTKTVEAMKYGKYIFGTNEAFQGFEVDFNRIGGLCNDDSDFINKLNVFLEKDELFNDYSHDYFVNNLAIDRVKENFINNLEKAYSALNLPTEPQ